MVFNKLEHLTHYNYTLLAGDQWWPRTSGGRLRFEHAVMHLLRHRFGHFVEKKTKKNKGSQKRLIQFSAWKSEDTQFYQPTFMQTSLHFRGMITIQTHIIKYINKHIQIAV